MYQNKNVVKTIYVNTMGLFSPNLYTSKRLLIFAETPCIFVDHWSSCFIAYSSVSIDKCSFVFNRFTCKSSKVIVDGFPITFIGRFQRVVGNEWNFHRRDRQLHRPRMHSPIIRLQNIYFAQHCRLRADTWKARHRRGILFPRRAIYDKSWAACRAEQSRPSAALFSDGATSRAL